MKTNGKVSGLSLVTLQDHLLTVNLKYDVRDHDSHNVTQPLEYRDINPVT